MENTRRLKLTRAPAPPGSNGSTDNCRKQKPAVSSAMNAEFVADAVFHGVVYKCGVETNRWVDLSRGFAKLTIGRDQTSNGVAIMVAQEGEKEPISMPVGSNVKIKRTNLFIQWTCYSGGPVAYGVYFPRQKEAIEFERNLTDVLQSEHEEVGDLGQCRAQQSSPKTQASMIHPKEIVMKVHLPAKQTTTVSVSPNMSVHDFLLYVCERRHLRVSAHGLSLPPDCPGKRPQQFDGRTKIGSLRTSEVHVVQLCNGDIPREKLPTPMSSQNHLLLQVYLPRNGEKTTVSVCPDMLVHDLLSLICEKRGLNPLHSSLELVRPTSKKREIEMQCRVGDLKVNEVKLVHKGGEENGRSSVVSFVKKQGISNGEQVHVEVGKQKLSKANTLTPEWEQLFAIGGISVSEASDPAAAATVSNLVTKHGGLQAVLKSETACSSVLTQFSEYLSLRRRQLAPAQTAQSPGRPRKRAAPPPPVLQQCHSPRMLSAPQGTHLTVPEEVRTHNRAGSTPIPLQLPKSPKVKGRAPLPPKTHDKLDEGKGLGRSSAEPLISSVQLKSTRRSLFTETPAARGEPSSATVVAASRSSNSTVENGAEDCVRLDNEPVSGNTDLIFTADTLPGPFGDLVVFNHDASNDLPYIDLPPPPPPAIDKWSPMYDDIEDLPPPPMGIDPDFPWAIAHDDDGHHDDVMPPPPEIVSEEEKHTEPVHETAKTPPGAQKSSEARAAFEMEMDELTSLLDSVVAEAEAYLSSPEVHHEPSRVISKDTTASQVKRPPPIAQKPKVFPKPGRKPTKLPPPNQANPPPIEKIKASNLLEVNNSVMKKDQRAPPKPIPYAQSPAAKRRLIQSQNSTTGNSSPTSTQAVASHVNAVDGRRNKTFRNQLRSYEHKGSITPSPRPRTQIGKDTSPLVSRERSNSLPICADWSETVPPDPGPELESPNFLMSDSTGTIRGVKHQVRTFLEQHDADSSKGQTMKKRNREVLPRQADCNQEPATGKVDEGLLKSVQSPLLLPSRPRKASNKIIFTIPPPPPIPPSSPPLSPSRCPLSPLESYRHSSKQTYLQETDQTFAPEGSSTKTPEPPSFEMILNPDNQTETFESLPIPPSPVESVDTDLVDEDKSGVPVDHAAALESDLGTDSNLCGEMLDCGQSTSTATEMGDDKLDESPAVANIGLPLKEDFRVEISVDLDNGAITATTAKESLLQPSSLTPPDEVEQNIELDTSVPCQHDLEHEQAALQSSNQTTVEETSQYTGRDIGIQEQLKENNSLHLSEIKEDSQSDLFQAATDHSCLSSPQLLPPAADFGSAGNLQRGTKEETSLDKPRDCNSSGECSDQSKLEYLPSTADASDIAFQSMSLPPVSVSSHLPFSLQKGMELQDGESVGQQNILEPSKEVHLPSSDVSLLNAYEQPLSPDLDCPQAASIAEQRTLSPSPDPNEAICTPKAETGVTSGPHVLSNNGIPSIVTVDMPDKAVASRFGPSPCPENPPPPPDRDSNYVSTLSGPRFTDHQIALYETSLGTNQHDYHTNDVLAAFTSAANSERHLNTADSHEICTPITDIDFDYQGRLVKSRSEDVLLSSKDTESLSNDSSGSTMSLTDTIQTSARKRSVRAHRWNSDVDLSALYNPYRDTYGKVLIDIRSGDNFARLRKVCMHVPVFFWLLLLKHYAHNAGKGGASTQVLAHHVHGNGRRHC
jgi:hypothetical protein